MKYSKKIKDISSIGIADIIGSGISALFWLYIASEVGPEGYGEITYFFSIAMLTSTISLLGASNTNIVYTAKNIQIQSTLYIIALSTSIVSLFVVLFLFNNLGSSFLIFGLVVFGLSTSEILGRKLYRRYSIFIITHKILMIIFAISFYHAIGINGVLIGYTISYLPYLYVIVQAFRTTKIDFSLYKTKLHFIIPQYFQTLSGSLSGSLDKLIIGPIFGFGLLGNYSLGLQFFTMLTILPAIVGKYIIPQDSSGNENKKLKEIIIIVSIGLAITGYLFGHVVTSTIFPKFLAAEEVIKIISWAIIPSTITTVYHSKFYGSEKSKNVLISSLIWTGTQVLGIIILGNSFGVNGIAASLVLGGTASAIFVVIIDKKQAKKTT